MPVSLAGAGIALEQNSIVIGVGMYGFLGIDSLQLKPVIIFPTQQVGDYSSRLDISADCGCCVDLVKYSFWYGHIVQDAIMRVPHEPIETITHACPRV